MIDLTDSFHLESVLPIGLALAMSLSETFCQSQSFVIIATHFRQLTSIGYQHRNIANYHFDVKYGDQICEEDKGIVYSYTLRPGICEDLHYGLALAGQIEDLHTVVELAKCIAKYYIRKKEVS